MGMVGVVLKVRPAETDPGCKGVKLFLCVGDHVARGLLGAVNVNSHHRTTGAPVTSKNQADVARTATTAWVWEESALATFRSVWS